MTEEMKKIMLNEYFESLHKCLEKEMDSYLADPALKCGFDSGYACAMQRVSVYVSRIEEILEG